jgi:hypothetical protein
VDEPGGRWSEAASVEVEGLKVRFEVDVEPLATRGLGVPGRDLDQASPDTSVLEHAVRFRVEQEGVVSAVPGDVHEADDCPISRSGRDPTETVRAYLIPPALYRPSTVRTYEANQLGIRQ